MSSLCLYKSRYVKFAVAKAFWMILIEIFASHLSHGCHTNSFWSYKGRNQGGYSILQRIDKGMKQVTVTKQVNAPADKIWEIVRTGNDIDKWMPIIASCTLVGRGKGAKRTCTTAEGKTLEETIINVDDMNKELIYSIDKQEMMPIQNIINKVRISESMNNTTIHWKAEFDMLDDSMFPAVEQGLKDLFGMGIQGLESAAMMS